MRYKCHNSQEYYYYSGSSTNYGGDVCSNDPHFYQACDKRLDGYSITNGEILCENYMCYYKVHYPGLPNPMILLLTKYTLREWKWACDGLSQCLNKKRGANNTIDETGCIENTVKLRSGQEVNSHVIFNDKCESFECEDEANCNGLTYGIYCKLNYVPPWGICDGSKNCDDGEDEANCAITGANRDMCEHSISRKLVPVYNFTTLCSNGQRLQEEH